MPVKESRCYVMFPKTIEELNQIRHECRTIVNKRAFAAAAATVIPIPGSDVLADLTILLQLFKLINQRFGLSPEQIEQLDPATKTMILSLVSSLRSQFIGKVMTEELVVKVLNKLGKHLIIRKAADFVSLFGRVATAGISFGILRHLGHSHIEECYALCKRVIMTQQSTITDDFEKTNPIN